MSAVLLKPNNFEYKIAMARGHGRCEWCKDAMATCAVWRASGVKACCDTCRRYHYGRTREEIDLEKPTERQIALWWAR